MGNIRMVIIYGTVAVILLALMAGIIGGTVPDGNSKGHVAWILLWPIIVYAVITYVYTLNDGSWLFGKSSHDGHIPMWRKIVLLPYLFPMRAIWWTRHKFILKENPYDKISPNIYVGRYCMKYPQEFPQEATVVVDLTAEFGQDKEVVKGREYFLLTALDCTMPPPKQLTNLAQRLCNMREDNIFYIHCANGHGRSSSLAALMMVIQGVQVNWRDAFEEMKKHRPLINIQPPQERILDRAQALLDSNGKDLETADIDVSNT
eukprot:gb/GECG01009442.1/.p1 GENE.gb/GECG01009442.1/~~gb/GECG01009442.1/.p1  ORF type:complete len:261 (+),score=14.84 gb/GECG01009442.1/:1-783(+)